MTPEILEDLADLFRHPLDAAVRHQLTLQHVEAAFRLAIDATQAGDEYLLNTLPAPTLADLTAPLFSASCVALANDMPDDQLRAAFDMYLATHRPADLPPPEPGLRWLGLQLKQHSSTGPDTAVVEFVARSKLGGRAHRLHETSRFVREGGRWYYTEGSLHT